LNKNCPIAVIFFVNLLFQPTGHEGGFIFPPNLF